MPTDLSGPAPAKLNLVLEVTGRRADGYHEIETVLQTLELADTVTIAPGNAPIAISGPYAQGTPADTSNLAWRAAAALAARTGRSIDGLAIRLEKAIPPAGGLGGGASDAATVLRLLQTCWPEATDEILLEVAASIGSDEPALVLGGTVLAAGRGEIVRPLPTLPRHGVVLFVPRATLDRKTARMFAAIGKTAFDRGGLARAFDGGSFSSADVFNAFERVAFDLFPALATLWEALEGRLGAPVRLAGAGPTLFWIGSVRQRDAVAAAANGLDCGVIATATAGPLWRR